MGMEAQNHQRLAMIRLAHRRDLARRGRIEHYADHVEALLAVREEWALDGEDIARPTVRERGAA